jgi:hypothetical protein
MHVQKRKKNVKSVKPVKSDGGKDLVHWEQCCKVSVCWSWNFLSEIRSGIKIFIIKDYVYATIKKITIQYRYKV